MELKSVIESWSVKFQMDIEFQSQKSKLKSKNGNWELNLISKFNIEIENRN